MIHQIQSTDLSSVVQLLADNGFEGMADAIPILFNEVAKITAELCGLDVSSTQVSRAAKLLDGELDTWRNRPLDQIECLILDARYEKVRVAGSVRDCAVLVAIGIKPCGHRSVLGVSLPGGSLGAPAPSLKISVQG